jgi:hypothetical protein
MILRNPPHFVETEDFTLYFMCVAIKFDLLNKIQRLMAFNCKSQVPVAHVCNPSYSGGKDQED